MSPERRFSFFPRTLAQCVEPLTRPVLKAQGLAGTRILTDWPNIVGKELAAHSYPVKLTLPPGKKNGGTLTIATENGFATEIQYAQPVILERLAGYFGYQAVNRIAIIHDNMAPKAKKARVLKPTLTADSIRATDGVADDELKAALASLAATLSGTRT